MKHVRPAALEICLSLVVVIASILSIGAPAFAQWSGFAQGPQHRAETPVSSQTLNRVIWSTPVDSDPQLSGGQHGIHYGSPLVTSANTVIVPVKTGAASGFKVDARRGADGSLIWTLPTDYVLPPSTNFVSIFGPAL